MRIPLAIANMDEMPPPSLITDNPVIMVPMGWFGGHLIGLCTGVNPKLVARAIAINSLAYCIVRFSCFKIGLEYYKSNRVYTLLSFLGCLTVHTLGIIVFRRLGIIGKLGTVVYGGVAIIVAVPHLCVLINRYVTS